MGREEGGDDRCRAASRRRLLGAAGATGAGMVLGLPAEAAGSRHHRSREVSL